MSPLWAGFFEHLKSCGRNAAMFLVSLAVLVVVAIMAGIVNGNDSHAGELLTSLVAGFGLAAVCLIVVAFRRAWKDYRGGRCGPLSSDELRIARSKLMSGMNGFKSVKPAERPPDTDLKY
jgi:hypothetical protein